MDDPAEVYGDLRGDRVPFGLDLEWETDGAVYPWIGTTRYEVPCTVHGEILVGDETIAFDGIGQRDHSWGVRDWWAFGWVWTAGGLDDGTRFHTTRVRIPGLDAFAPGYVQPPGGTPEQIEVCAAEEELDERRLPRSPPRSPAARSTCRSSRWPSPRCTWSTTTARARAAPVPAGAVPVRGGGRPQGRRLDRVEPAGLT